MGFPGLTAPASGAATQKSVAELLEEQIHVGVTFPTPQKQCDGEL